MNFLIFGRAFAGVGGAGLFVSSLAIIGEVTTSRWKSPPPPSDRFRLVDSC